MRTKENEQAGMRERERGRWVVHHWLLISSADALCVLSVNCSTTSVLQLLISERTMGQLISALGKHNSNVKKVKSQVSSMLSVEVNFNLSRALR